MCKFEKKKRLIQEKNDQKKLMFIELKKKKD